jgi:DNA polymerase-1
MDAKNVAVDTETTGLDPHRDKVTLLSVSSRKCGTYVVDTRDVNCLKAFGELFENRNVYKTLHNAHFDYQMVKGTAGVNIENAVCTLLGERTLTAGLQFDGYGLADITEKYLSKSRDKSIRESFIGHTGDFSHDQINYAGDDTADLLSIAEIQQDAAKTKGVLRAWLIESGAVQSFADIEYYGQLIDRTAWEKVIADNWENAGVAKKELDYFFESVCDRDLFGDLDMNYESPAVILAKLQMMGIKVDGKIIRDTSKKTQKKIKDHPIMKCLARYRSAMKGAQGFGAQYMKAIHPVTGRVHFRFNQYGTETGRPACRGGLNCLNIPRETRYRSCFGTEPGRLISTVDYSGAELRIMADLSGDPLMVDGFNSGVDFHCFVASLLFDREVTKKNENAHLRTPTKTLNFGLAYGMGPNSLFDQLNAAGYPITFEDCKKLFYKYMDTFVVTIGWLKEQQSYASKHFHMTNINGRQRHWFEPNNDKIRASICADLEKKRLLNHYSDYQIENLVRDKRKAQLAAIQREGANFQIQSVNADFTKVAMARCRLAFKDRGWDARTYNSVYDEIVYDFAEPYAAEAHELQKKIMLEAANEMLHQVPMDVEGHLAKVWTK